MSRPLPYRLTLLAALAFFLGVQAGCAGTEPSETTKTPSDEGKVVRAPGRGTRSEGAQEDLSEIRQPEVAIAELPGGRPWPIPLPAGADEGKVQLLEWTESDRITHPLLRDGVEIVRWHATGAVPHPEKWTLLENGKSYEVRGEEGLRPFLRGIESGEDAVAYFALLRRLLPSEERLSQELGVPLKPSPEAIAHLGEYGPADADFWGIPQTPAPARSGEAFEIERPVLRYGDGADGSRLIPGRAAAWRVVLVRERVGPRGRYGARVLRLLDSDGGRFRAETE